MQHLSKTTSSALSQHSDGRQSDLLRAQYLTAAKMLLGCYRTGAANDPETYIASIIRVLTAYPIDVAMRVADPLCGLPGTSKWLPQAPEVREACEEIMGPRRREAEREERIKRQLAEREQEDHAREERPSYDDLKAKHGPNWGLQDGDAEIIGGKETPEMAARRTARRDLAIAREYAAAGVEPVMVGDLVLSPSLLRTLDKWPTA
jgi:hypothetical protein